MSFKRLLQWFWTVQLPAGGKRSLTNHVMNGSRGRCCFLSSGCLAATPLSPTFVVLLHDRWFIHLRGWIKTDA
ncbi:hypothetical protein, partial [Roseiconus lacunae]|uniref:hypothetical protein n=1 Tax=Roseiconus lacunae TaxID=2605694 RepID=UPI001F3EF63F